MIRRLVLVFAVVAVTAGCGATTAASTQPVPRFSHVIVVVFENKDKSEVMGSPAAPNFNTLGAQYAQLTDYHGVSHPSLPNYLALISGSTHGVTRDCTTCTFSGRSLADTLAAAHLSWKTYAESLPRVGYTGDGPRPYAKKHVPFLYFRNVLARPAWLRNVVPLSKLAVDLHANRLPRFSLVVPNMCNDGHDCPVQTTDRWLGQHIVPLLRSPQLAKSVVFVIFDEGESSVGGGGNVPALALGPLVQSNLQYNGSLDHYSLLRTIEDAWKLPLLGRSRTARPITGIWR